jgi:hypothetical protein
VWPRPSRSRRRRQPPRLGRTPHLLRRCCRGCAQRDRKHRRATHRAPRVRGVSDGGSATRVGARRGAKGRNTCTKGDERSPPPPPGNAASLLKQLRERGHGRAIISTRCTRCRPRIGFRRWRNGRVHGERARQPAILPETSISVRTLLATATSSDRRKRRRTCMHCGRYARRLVEVAPRAPRLHILESAVGSASLPPGKVVKTIVPKRRA